MSIKIVKMQVKVFKVSN